MGKHRIVIEPGREISNYWKDIWNFRGLFYFLAWRDILVRYKQTTIGILWSLVRPLMTIVVMWFLGGFLGSKVPSGVPRGLFVCIATLPWQFFSSSFSEISNSLISNSNLLTKVYFPRLIIPFSTIIVSLIDFLISFAIMIGIMVYYQFVPDVKILLVPFFLLLAFITSLGIGLYIAALNVKYRDFRYVVPFIVQFGLYASPIAWSTESVLKDPRVPEFVKLIYPLNPMVGVIDGFRWCILGGNSPLDLTSFTISVGVSVMFLIIGVWYFRKVERSFADVI